MLKYPCLVLDHDDTVVQSEATVNYPFFCYILNQFRPGTKITLHEYTEGCFRLGFADMCRKWYNFTEQEIVDEYHGWQKYIVDHIPAPFPGIGDIIRRQKEAGGKSVSSPIPASRTSHGTTRPTSASSPTTFTAGTYRRNCGSPARGRWSRSWQNTAIPSPSCWWWTM